MAMISFPCSYGQSPLSNHLEEKQVKEKTGIEALFEMLLKDEKLLLQEHKGPFLNKRNRSFAYRLTIAHLCEMNEINAAKWLLNKAQREGVFSFSNISRRDFAQVKVYEIEAKIFIYQKENNFQVAHQLRDKEIGIQTLLCNDFLIHDDHLFSLLETDETEEGFVLDEIDELTKRIADVLSPRELEGESGRDISMVNFWRKV